MNGFRPPKAPALPEAGAEYNAAEFAAMVQSLRTYFRQIDAIFALMSRDLPLASALPEFGNDAAAAAGGVDLYGFYRQGSNVHQRVT